MLTDKTPKREHKNCMACTLAESCPRIEPRRFVRAGGNTTRLALCRNRSQANRRRVYIRSRGRRPRRRSTLPMTQRAAENSASRCTASAGGDPLTLSTALALDTARARAKAYSTRICGADSAERAKVQRSDGIINSCEWYEGGPGRSMSGIRRGGGRRRGEGEEDENSPRGREEWPLPRHMPKGCHTCPALPPFAAHRGLQSVEGM